MRARGSRLRGRRRRPDVIEPPVEPEKQKLSVSEAISVHLGDARSAVPEGYQSTPDSDRSQAITVLGSLVSMIEAIDPEAGRRVAIPLNQLRFALMQLNFGLVVPLLQPPKLKSGRPSDSFARVALRGLTSGVISILMEVGLSRTESAKKVAAVLRARKIEKVNWTTIARWRYQAPRPGRRPHRAFRTYQIVIWKEKAVVEELNRGSPNEAARSRYVKDFLERFGQLIDDLRAANS
jgi:hypothetical protein